MGEIFKNIQIWVKDNPTFATILIPILVFFLGLLFQGAFYAIRKHNERRNKRESIKNMYIDTLRKLKKRIIQIENLIPMLSINYPPGVKSINVSNITYADFIIQQDIDNIYNAHINHCLIYNWVFRKVNKNRIRAIDFTISVLKALKDNASKQFKMIDSFNAERNLLFKELNKKFLEMHNYWYDYQLELNRSKEMHSKEMSIRKEYILAVQEVFVGFDAENKKYSKRKDRKIETIKDFIIDKLIEIHKEYKDTSIKDFKRLFVQVNIAYNNCEDMYEMYSAICTHNVSIHKDAQRLLRKCYQILYGKISRF